MMKIAILQTNPIWKDTKANLSFIKEYMDNIEGSIDLLVLPEMFNTAYVMSPAEVAETLDGYTVSAMTSIASNYNMAILGSIPRKNGDQYYNTCITVNKEGVYHTYDKQHLFALAGENLRYTSGAEPSKPMEIAGIYIAPLICYDLRFPYASWKIGGAQMPHVIIYSANWPQPRIHHWEALLMARAVENQCYVIGANRVGYDQNDLTYPGKSMAVKYDGTVMVEMNDQVGHTIIEIDKEALEKYRKKMPFLIDAIQP
jgi:omega-amidase